MGVVAVTVVALLGPGPWTLEESAIAFVIAIVLFAFYGPAWRNAPNPERLALMLILWLVLTVGTAYPVQAAWHSECRHVRPGSNCSEQQANDATLGAAAAAAVLIESMYIWWLRRTSRS